MAEKKIDEINFRALSPHENWYEIQQNIIKTFCVPAYQHQKPAWLWNGLKSDYVSFSDFPGWPEEHLDKIIEPGELIWFIVNETINEQTKFWLYEGKINTILEIIQEIHFDELYFISKKYEWLICINHHDYLIATGGDMPDKLVKLHSSYSSTTE